MDGFNKPGVIVLAATNRGALTLRYLPGTTHQTCSWDLRPSGTRADAGVHLRDVPVEEDAERRRRSPESRRIPAPNCRVVNEGVLLAARDDREIVNKTTRSRRDAEERRLRGKRHEGVGRPRQDCRPEEGRAVGGGRGGAVEATAGEQGGERRRETGTGRRTQHAARDPAGRDGPARTGTGCTGGGCREKPSARGTSSPSARASENAHYPAPGSRVL